MTSPPARLIGALARLSKLGFGHRHSNMSIDRQETMLSAWEERFPHSAYSSTIYIEDGVRFCIEIDGNLDSQIELGVCFDRSKTLAEQMLEAAEKAIEYIESLEAKRS